MLVEGKPSQFREWTRQVGLHEDGVGSLLARGSAIADYDNDGDLDVAINTIGGPPALLRNDGAAGNWFQIELDGFYPGAVVEVVLPDGRSLLRQWHSGSSYLASEDPRCMWVWASLPRRIVSLFVGKARSGNKKMCQPINRCTCDCRIRAMNWFRTIFLE